MSGNEFEDEVKSIQGRHEKPRILYKSRSIKVTIYAGNSPVNFTVPFRRVDEAIDKASSLSDGTGYEQALLDKLLYAGRLYKDQIKGKKAPRGGSAEVRGVVFSIQYAAALTYLLLSERGECNQETGDLLLRAETQVKRLLPGWQSYNRLQKDWLITAFLVDRAFRQERQKAQLVSPVENREKEKDPKPDAYYVTYIVPRLSWAKEQLARNPHLFDFAKAEPIRPAPNAYLRRVFKVLSKLKEES